MSKSKPQTESATTDTSTSIPTWLEDAGQRAVSRGEDLSNLPYKPYTGELVAPQSADTLSSYQDVRDMQGKGSSAYTSSLDAYGNLVGQAKPLTTSDINDNTNSFYGNYKSSVLAPAQGLLGGYLKSGPTTAASVGADAQTLMSPYTQSVIDPTLKAGEQSRQIARQKVAGNAANVGAFGGSRQGVAEGVSDSQYELGTQLEVGKLLDTGWGTATKTATDLGLQSGKQGYDAAGLLSNLGATGYTDSQKTGSALADTNLRSGLTAASNLPTTATAQQKYDQLDASLLQTTGADQQNYQQLLDNAAYGQYYDEQGYPIQSLDLLLGSLSGTPYSTTGTGTSTKTTNLNKNAAGGILGGALSGAATGATISGGNPYVAAGGAVIGGISGALN